MNVYKTELHVMRANGHADLVSRYKGKISTKKPRGAPHAVYKYLGVHFCTSNHATKVLDFIQAEIDSFDAHLAPLNLSATELIMLTNKQLIPTVAYRLLASPLTDGQFALTQSKIWSNLGRYGRLPRGLSPKNRYDRKFKGCFGLMPFQIFMRSQIYNYWIRYLNSGGPKQSNSWVYKALTAENENWLQVAFVDSVHALGGRCHVFGAWNPCPVKALQEGEVTHVEFNTGWYAGTVLSHDSESSVLIRFHTDDTRFNVRDKHHSFFLHRPALTGPAPLPTSAHAQLAAPLCSLPAPLPPYPIPHRCSPIGETEEGFLFQYHERLPQLQVSDLRAWGCLSVALAVEHTHSDHGLWVYIDGSWDDP